MINKVFPEYKSRIASHLSSIPGWRTTRKIVVIESDDWGSIRMPSKEVYNSLLSKGIRVDNCPYNKYDSLENKDDFEALFKVLRKYRDNNGNHPVITANTVMANPDFEKIGKANYGKYSYEPFTKTYENHRNVKLMMQLWGSGMDDKIIWPQFHGREHVNVELWLRLLRNGNKEFIEAFNMGLYGLGPEVHDYKSRIHIQASFDATNESSILNHGPIIKDGLELFEEIFKFKSRSFIANNFIWDSALNSILANGGVEFIQGMRYQKLPILNNKRRKLNFNYTGKKNKQNQTYLVRNCIFEPTENSNSDSVSICLQQISVAFLWKKPAIISSHRLNFIGSIDPNNRKQNLMLFDKLIDSILKVWPDVEFRSSDQLGDIITSDIKKQ